MTRRDSKTVETSGYVSLPPAARRWIDHVLPSDAAIPSRIRIRQEGSMEVRGRWIPFTADGTYEGAPLSFDWKARLRMRPGIWIVADDGHSNGRGWGGARLWGVVPMGRRTDPEVLVTQLIRNIGELAWLPGLGVTDPDLKWDDAGADAFEVRGHAAGREVMVRFDVDDQGDIIRASSPARPYDVPGGYAEAPWHYDFGDHRDFDGIRIPSTAVAT
jgi:hypothetical protein